MMTGPNPYEAPKAQPAPPAPAAGGSRRLASRGKRFFGSMIDTLFALPIASGLSYGYASLTGQERSAGLLQACMYVPFMVQWAFVTTRGQTIGKILLKTRVVMADGRLPGFVHGVALRVWPVLALSVFAALAPAAASGPLRTVATLVATIDVLAIFSGDRRCFHDLLAGTYVVDAG